MHKLSHMGSHSGGVCYTSPERPLRICGNGALLASLNSPSKAFFHNILRSYALSLCAGVSLGGALVGVKAMGLP